MIVFAGYRLSLLSYRAVDFVVSVGSEDIKSVFWAHANFVAFQIHLVASQDSNKNATALPGWSWTEQREFRMSR